MISSGDSVPTRSVRIRSGWAILSAIRKKETCTRTVQQSKRPYRGDFASGDQLAPLNRGRIPRMESAKQFSRCRASHRQGNFFQ